MNQATFSDSHVALRALLFRTCFTYCSSPATFSPLLLPTSFLLPACTKACRRRAKITKTDTTTHSSIQTKSYTIFQQQSAKLKSLDQKKKKDSLTQRCRSRLTKQFVLLSSHFLLLFTKHLFPAAVLFSVLITITIFSVIIYFTFHLLALAIVFPLFYFRFTALTDTVSFYLLQLSVHTLSS